MEEVNTLGHDTDYCFANNPDYPCHCNSSNDWKKIATALYEYFVLGIGISTCVQDYISAINSDSNEKGK